MAEEHLILVRLILNPWNAVLGFCVWAGIQTVKSMVPALQEGGGLHHTLRFACVAACTTFYFMPGPWLDHETSTGTKMILGLITGTVTTIAHGLVSDLTRGARRVLRRRVRAGDIKGVASDLDAFLGTGKKLVTWIGAVGVAFSGVYGAWLKPETGAKTAYVATEKGFKDISDDMAKVTTAHNLLDKQTAIELALLRKRIEELETELEKRHRRYKAPKVAVRKEEVSMTTQIAQRHVRLPAPKDLFK